MGRLVYKSTDRCSACADKRPYAHGLCHGCYDRVRKHGTAERSFGGTPWEVAWRNLEPTDDSCWIWRGALAGSGYGQVQYKNKCWGAHRFVYQVVFGYNIPDNLVLDHLCRVITCCNPDHLEPVTVEENINRGLVPGIKCEHGESDLYIHWRATSNGRAQKVRQCRTCNLSRAKHRQQTRRIVNGVR